MRIRFSAVGLKVQIQQPANGRLLLVVCELLFSFNLALLPQSDLKIRLGFAPVEMHAELF